MDSNFVENLKVAFWHGLKTVAYLLFVTPIEMYAKVVNRMAEQSRNKFLNISCINSPYPVLTFLLRLTTQFAFDFCTLIAYPVGVVVAGYIAYNLGYGRPSEKFITFLLGLISTYYTPWYFQLMRDGIQFMLLPLRKLFSWLKKPAQYVYIKKEEVTIEK
ncbi:MAG: hypothetical protein SOX83_03345 [Sodaliphilus sp.]|nr:hypothetical protein [Sodaliphilus sp.]